MRKQDSEDEDGPLAYDSGSDDGEDEPDSNYVSKNGRHIAPPQQLQVTFSSCYQPAQANKAFINLTPLASLLTSKPKQLLSLNAYPSIPGLFALQNTQAGGAANPLQDDMGNSGSGEDRPAGPLINQALSLSQESSTGPPSGVAVDGSTGGSSDTQGVEERAPMIPPESSTNEQETAGPNTGGAAVGILEAVSGGSVEDGPSTLFNRRRPSRVARQPLGLGSALRTGTAQEKDREPPTLHIEVSCKGNHRHCV